MLLLAGVDLVPRVLFWFDPVLDNRSRYWDEFRPRQFVGVAWASSAMATRQADGRSQAAYESSPTLPRDRWGRPWILVRDESSQLWLSICSRGEDGIFEWGEGDDIDVLFGDRFARTWWFLAVLAGLVAIPYFSIRVARLPRASSTAGELIRASIISIAPIALSFIIIVRGFPHLEQLTPTYSLVPGHYAVVFGASFIIWIAILLVRLRRP